GKINAALLCAPSCVRSGSIVVVDTHHIHGWFGEMIPGENPFGRGRDEAVAVREIVDESDWHRNSARSPTRARQCIARTSTSRCIPQCTAKALSFAVEQMQRTTPFAAPQEQCR